MAERKSGRQYDNKLIIVGGTVTPDGSNKGEVNRDCWKLNQDKQFVKLCKIPYDDLQAYHSVCKTPEGFVITGGQHSDLCILFIAATKSWVRLQNMLMKRWKHGSICIKGMIYVFGGETEGKEEEGKEAVEREEQEEEKDLFTSVDRYCMETGSWEHMLKLPTVVLQPSVVEFHHDVYMYIGGQSDHEHDQLLQLQMGPESQKWIRRASPPRDLQKGSCGRYNNNMVVVNDKLCVADPSKGTYVFYVPSTGKWSKVHERRTVQMDGALVYYDDTVLLLGGRNEFMDFTDGSGMIEEYSIKKDHWSISKLKMPASLRAHHALVVEMPEEE